MAAGQKHEAQAVELPADALEAAPTSKGEIEVVASEPEEQVMLEHTPEGTWIVRWWKRRIAGPFMLIIRRGAEPKQLAMSAALGITLGVFPIYGVTVFLCGLALLLLRSRCNAPTLMLANFVATPLEVALIYPFLRLGELVTNGGHIVLSSNALWDAVSGHATKDLLLAVLHALIGWGIAAPFIFALLYMLLLPIFTCMVNKFGGGATADLEIGLLRDDENPRTV